MILKIMVSLLITTSFMSPVMAFEESYSSRGQREREEQRDRDQRRRDEEEERQLRRAQMHELEDQRSRRQTPGIFGSYDR